jgi:ribosomal protein L6P/L9E
MSRVAKSPVVLGSGITAEIKGQTVTVKVPNCSISINMNAAF